MASKNHMVALNGKVYDSSSGKVINGVTKHVSTKSSHPHAKAIHHRSQHAKTLMRSAVKQPVTKHKVLKKAGSSKPDKPTFLTAKLEHDRAVRAETVSKSKLISRFNDVADRPRLTKHTMPLPVKKAPEEAITYHSSPVIPDSIELQPLIPSDLLTQALDKAMSHTEKLKHGHKRRHKLARKVGVSNKVFAISSSTIAIALMVGFFAYQNAPNAAFRVAAKSAGVRASLPGYKPAGYAMKGPVQSAPGQITVSFRTSTDDRSYTLTQKSSSWNSSTLLENYVATGRRSYQTIEDGGRTIYLYDDASATWVEGGVWYQIEGDSSLSSDQLLHIAASI